MSFDRQTVKVLAKVLAVCTVTAVGVGAYAAGADLGQTTKQPTNWVAIGMFGTFVLFHAVHHQVGSGQDQERGRLLHRGRGHHRLPEWPGDRRRLHVGSVVLAFPASCSPTASTA